MLAFSCALYVQLVPAEISLESVSRTAPLLLPRWGLGLRVFGGAPYGQIDGGEDWAPAELELRTVTDFK